MHSTVVIFMPNKIYEQELCENLMKIYSFFECEMRRRKNLNSCGGGFRVLMITNLTFSKCILNRDCIKLPKKS